MALCAPYDKTGIDQVQAERLSMSWIERIKSNITPTRKASIPEVYGPSATAAVRYSTAPSWSATWRFVLSAITICACRRVIACIACWMKVLW